MEGIGESDWCRSKWPDNAEHREGIKRREQTCQDNMRTWQPGSRSVNNTVDKGLWNVFLKCDITAFNGNWAERSVVIHLMSPHKKILHTFHLSSHAAAQPTRSDGLSLSVLACQDIIRQHKQLIKILVCHRVQL